MTNLRIDNLTPFVPAKNFELSSRFYNDLGFSTVASIEKAVRFERDGCGFWLQDYYVEDWAGNFMFCLYVQDLDAWWSHIRTMRFDDAYGGTESAWAAWRLASSYSWWRWYCEALEMSTLSNELGRHNIALEPSAPMKA